MHQQQWLAAIEDMGGAAGMPIPNSFPQEREQTEFSYALINTFLEGVPNELAAGRWASGPSMDGRGKFTLEPGRPLGEEQRLAEPPPDGELRPSSSPAMWPRWASADKSSARAGGSTDW